MAYKGGEFSVEDLYVEIHEQALREKVEDIEQYKEIVENLVEEKKSYGFVEDRDDWPQIVRNLMLRWPDVERDVRKKVGKPVL